VPAKPAAVVGLQQAQSRRSKKQSAVPPPQPPPVVRRDGPPPIPSAPPPVPSRGPATMSRKPNESRPPPLKRVPPPFGEEPTRQVDDELLHALRTGQVARPTPPPPGGPGGRDGAPFGNEPTRVANIDPRAYDETGLEERTARPNKPKTPSPLPEPFGRPSEMRPTPQWPPNTLPTDPSNPPLHIDDHGHDEATSIASLDGIAAMERARHGHTGNNDERTRAVNIRNDPSISDIDWDLD
jgi:hypothetical protein